MLFKTIHSFALTPVLFDPRIIDKFATAKTAQQHRIAAAQNIYVHDFQFARNRVENKINKNKLLQLKQSEKSVNESFTWPKCVCVCGRE